MFSADMKTTLREARIPDKDSKALRFLYGNIAGRCILRVIRAKWVSKVAGVFLNTKLSKPLIKPFIKNNNIDLNDYENIGFSSFNDCFSRKIKQHLRPVAEEKNALVSPCDAYLSVYKIKNDSVYPIKQSRYTVASLLKNNDLAEEFKDGYIFVFRLCVEHYHRYIYPVSGEKGKNIHINGTLHTVRPVALYNTSVFCENSREYTVIESDDFGKIVQMEVGALFVGKIKNFHGECRVEKGTEKGMFLYGGSTVILLCKKEYVTPADGLLQNTEKGLETPVLQGEIINEI